MLRKLFPIAAGVALGFLLFYISSLVEVNNPYNSAGTIAWGFPFFWRINATGSGSPVLGVNFALDLVFWLALSLIIVEVLSHFAVMHRRRIRTHQTIFYSPSCQT